MGRGVSILHAIVRECFSKKVIFAQRTEGNKTESLMDIYRKITAIVINVPTGNLLGFRTSGL